jgi:colicin import membrane protein
MQWTDIDRNPALPTSTEKILGNLGSVAVHVFLFAALFFYSSFPRPEPEQVVQVELWSSLPAPNPPQSGSLSSAVQSSLNSEALGNEPSRVAGSDLKEAFEAEIFLDKRIAEERKKQKEIEERLVKEKAEKEKQLEKKAAVEKAAREKAAKERAEKEKAELAEAAKQAKIAREEAAKELKKREEEERLAKKRAEDEKRRQEAKLKKTLEAQRREQEEAILKQFGSDPKAKAADAGKDRTTKAGVSGGAEVGDRSGVLADYSASIRARIRARITFDPARAPNNPEAIFEVTQLSTGQISKVTLKKSSGNLAWDAAVERAIQASTPLPKAADGSVEPLLILSFRPLDPR